MKTLFCDASFDWTHTENNGENVVRGKIAIADGDGFARIEKVVVGKVPTLKQYINILELVAIARAVELANQNKWTGGLQVITDSQVAMWWARSKKVKEKVATDAHTNAIDYLKRVCKEYVDGVIVFDQIRREKNPAGHLLAEELEKEKPHAI